MKSIISLFVLVCISVSGRSQVVLETLRDRPETKYLRAYGDRFFNQQKSEYYFIIDDGQKDIESSVDSLIRNLPIQDSSSYLGYRKGGKVSFNSPVDFLTIMYHYGWELVFDQSVQAIENSDGSPASNYRRNKINVFVLKRKDQ